ncbi:ABC-2 type transporter [Colletotrichum karsti]|uniref:ABC-2 type transporter n=1 Tax=Colletotrichum karsti TaxID=1095194 RepID=A0A9P6LJD1_9PEZI|nr:ABC-2 type transporter [Colletotrichum karsti]KAF9878249.1 ABC-2 type transporter [Colletotrichum karsti]
MEQQRTGTRGSYGSSGSSVTMNGRPSTEQWDGGFAPINTGKNNGDSSDDNVTLSSPTRDTHRDTMMMDEEDRRELQRIATTLSQRQSGMSFGQAQSIELANIPTSGDPALDPTSKSFDLSKWLQNVMQQMQNEGISIKNAGVAYKDLNVSGTGAALQLQQTVGSFLQAPLRIGEHLSFGKKEPKRILNSFDGILNSGELLIVLGRPGSGCSTLLKTMTGELHGLGLSDESVIHYNGIPQKRMIKEFKGETVYNQEVDKHFPHLTVGQTLEFAAAVRTPSRRLQGMSRDEYCKNAAQIVMAVCGLSHTYNTKVGNDFVRGVSGGERKRVSIAEMMLAGSPMCAWDNSTRGLDSATALKFVQALRLASDFTGSANAVAIYQASQAIYDLFDKAVVLYEGRQIYFGPAFAAKSYFERMGWECPQRQTTGDFLTSVTNPQERKARPGMETRVPRTPEEFEAYWRQSPEYAALRQEIEEHQHAYPIDSNSQALSELRQMKNERQAKHVRPKSPYIISMGMQVRLTTKRAYQRIWNDMSATATSAVINLMMALIIGSVFYGTPDSTSGFYAKGSVLFQAILMNALTAISEINSLYDQRPIVEKHASYAFYHPAAEAIAGVVADIPIKFITATTFNLVLYFLAGLRREPGQFFLYFLITYMSTFVMSAVFRTMAAITKTVSQAMMLAGVLVLALVIYTGFVVRVPQMVVWFSWLRWINPIFYAFEILIANEFHGREFVCSEIIPSYTPLIGDSWICSAVGAVAGQRAVSGDAFIGTNYQYYYSHVWRNFGILIAFLVFFMVLYFTATELNSATTSTAEVLVFQRGHVPAHLQDGVSRSASNEEMAVSVKSKNGDGEANVSSIPPQKDIFTWRDVVYDIEIKGEPRRLLDNVSGWVKPGTLTALMGVSGAGKTTLLDVLAQRTTMGVITGDMFVNGKPLDASFQRKTGYVQQQDLHLETSTVRESLRFSAMLRQPKSVSKEEKYAFVEEVIDMLNMRDFADAVVGVPGEGLNVEQRKLLTIGVELAAKPKLLLFLDEPTSGLDSQSSWAICAFLRKLADSGQAVLCTVHQPSAILFQQFDRLLFLARGGKTVYFGDIGDNSRTLLNYFESHGARKCDDEENPAEYMLEIVNNGTNSRGEDWHTVWRSSNERHGVDAEIERIHLEKAQDEVAGTEEAGSHSEFAMPFSTQLVEVTTRVFQQYWRMPNYVFAKFVLGIAAGLFIGFSFYQADGTMAGMQNVVFAVFMVITIFSTIVQQIQPHFVTQRSLYEVRERPSKAYSWKAFMFANIIVEIPYQIVTGILIFACFYYPVIGVQASSRQGLVLLFAIQLFIYASSFAHMTIAAFPDALTASGVVTMLVLMSLTFCGVLQSPTALPGFWIFMYRVSPFTYWVSGIVSTQLHSRPVTCSASETSIFNPPANQTCGEYLADYLKTAPGQLQNPDALEQCRYCSLSNADQYLAGSNIFWDERWRNFGIVWAFIFFNIFVAVMSYYLFRVKKWNSGSSKSKKDAKGKAPATQ